MDLKCDESPPSSYAMLAELSKWASLSLSVFESLPASHQMDGLDVLQDLVNKAVLKITNGRVTSVRFVPCKAKPQISNSRQADLFHESPERATNHSSNSPARNGLIKEEPVEAELNSNEMEHHIEPYEYLEVANAITSYENGEIKEDGGSETDDYEFRIMDIESTAAKRNNCSKDIRRTAIKNLANLTKTKKCNGDRVAEVKTKKLNKNVPKSSVKKTIKYSKTKVDKLKKCVRIKDSSNQSKAVKRGKVDIRKLNNILTNHVGTSSSRNDAEEPCDSMPRTSSDTGDMTNTDSKASSFGILRWPPLIRPTKIKKVKKYACNLCSFSASRPNLLRYHKSVHTGGGPFVCESCNASFTAAGSLVRHRLCHTDTRDYQCPICGKAFRDLTSVRSHALIHTGQRCFKCSRCDKSYTFASNLRRHQRVHTGALPYACNVCPDVRYRDKSSLSLHMLKHTGERPYECAKCGKKFKTSSDWRRHERVHTGERRYECGQCGKSFTQGWALKTHALIHSNLANRFKCDLCVKTFRSKHALLYHVGASHTAGKGKNHECPICHKWFSCVAAVRGHQVIHTLEKPFICRNANCRKAFNALANLKRHERIHSDVRNYPCRYCERAFKYGNARRDHEQRFHLRNLPNDSLLTDVVKGNIDRDKEAELSVVKTDQLEYELVECQSTPDMINQFLCDELVPKTIQSQTNLVKLNNKKRKLKEKLFNTKIPKLKEKQLNKIKPKLKGKRLNNKRHKIKEECQTVSAKLKTKNNSIHSYRSCLNVFDARQRLSAPQGTGSLPWTFKSPSLKCGSTYTRVLEGAYIDGAPILDLYWPRVSLLRVQWDRNGSDNKSKELNVSVVSKLSITAIYSKENNTLFQHSLDDNTLYRHSLDDNTVHQHLMNDNTLYQCSIDDKSLPTYSMNDNTFHQYSIDDNSFHQHSSLSTIKQQSDQPLDERLLINNSNPVFSYTDTENSITEEGESIKDPSDEHVNIEDGVLRQSLEDDEVDESSEYGSSNVISVSISQSDEQSHPCVVVRQYQPIE